MRNSHFLSGALLRAPKKGPIKFYSVVKKIRADLNFPAFLLPAKPRAADAQPISPDATCVTELSFTFFALRCIFCSSERVEDAIAIVPWQPVRFR